MAKTAVHRARVTIGSRVRQYFGTLRISRLSNKILVPHPATVSGEESMLPDFLRAALETSPKF